MNYKRSSALRTVLILLFFHPSKGRILVSFESMRGGSAEVPSVQTDSDTTKNSTKLGFKSGRGNIIPEEERWRYDLPEQLQKRRGAIHCLQIPTGFQNTNSEDIYCQLYLLGTAHISKDSCLDAKLLMEFVSPDVLFVELCCHRVSVLTEEPAVNTNPGNRGVKPVIEMYKDLLKSNPEMSKLAALNSILLAQIQADLATKLGVSIGGEFRAAYKTAKAQQQQFYNDLQNMEWERMYGSGGQTSRMEHTNRCTIVLGDRPVQLTLLRTWESLSILGKCKLLIGLIWSSFIKPDLEELNEWINLIMNDPNSDVLSKSIEDLSLHFPSIMDTIIKERDTYMTCKLLQTASILGQSTAVDGKPRTIVAVVGAGHCSGIIQLIQEVRETPEERMDVQHCLKNIVETRKMKFDANENLKRLINEVQSMN